MFQCPWFCFHSGWERRDAENLEVRSNHQKVCYQWGPTRHSTQQNTTYAYLLTPFIYSIYHDLVSKVVSCWSLSCKSGHSSNLNTSSILFNKTARSKRNIALAPNTFAESSSNELWLSFVRYLTANDQSFLLAHCSSVSRSMKYIQCTWLQKH